MYKKQCANNYSNLTMTHFSHAGSLAESLKRQDAKIELLSMKACFLHVMTRSGSCKKITSQEAQSSYKTLNEEKGEGRTVKSRLSPNSSNRNGSTSRLLRCQTFTVLPVKHQPAPLHPRLLNCLTLEKPALIEFCFLKLFITAISINRPLLVTVLTIWHCLLSGWTPSPTKPDGSSRGHSGDQASTKKACMLPGCFFCPLTFENKQKFPFVARHKLLTGGKCACFLPAIQVSLFVWEKGRRAD